MPEIRNNTKLLCNKLKKSFPYLNMCLWSTSVYNEFMVHQPGRSYRLVEVEKDAIDAVFYFMKERNYAVFAEPSRELFMRYMSDEKEPWIVKSLVSEAPIQNFSGVPTATIEKMLVDIFCDDITFDAQQGSEMKNIFKEAFEKYAISESKMLRYADRRRKKKELNEFLNQVSKFRQQP